MIHNYIPQLEWEYSKFPLDIYQLKFEKTDWGFSDSSVITIWRDVNNELKGKIKGVLIEIKEENDFIGKGNIIKGQKISGSDSDGNIIEIQECFYEGVSTSSVQYPIAEGIILANSLKIKFSNCQKSQNLVRIDWFICNDIPAHFPGRTLRNLNRENKKIRIGLDCNDELIKISSGDSYSKDYVLINLSNLNFIIAKIPDNITNGNEKGICFEFREHLEKVENDLIDGIKYFISFLLGNKLKYFGYSVFNDGELDEVILFSSSKIANENSIPPIKFNYKYEWGDLSFLVNNYLPQYLKFRKTYSLDSAISRYWISRSIPIGSNLPILSNSLEIIAGKYLNQKEYSVEYINQDEYKKLINDELVQLKAKLSCINGGEIIMNKILGAFRKGPNEKMNSFLSDINITVSEFEKRAINLRNKMTHSERDYSNDETAYDDLFYTRVYEVLFHKVVLKLIGYRGCYIDYSVQGCPSKYINIEDNIS